MLLRLFLIIFFIPLQSCSNTVIGEKLENSFDDQIISEETNTKKRLKEIKEIKLSKKKDDKKNSNVEEKKIKENLLVSKSDLSQKSIKSIKKVIFDPQPYRIILKLSGANPSAPAETVTKALRKAGVQFEVEKIERYDEERLLKNTSFER